MRLICNSIPKSGTYLLASLAKFVGLVDQNIRFVDNGINVVDDSNNMVEFITDESPGKLNRLADGGYAPSHLSFSEALAEALATGGFRHLFIYRHPGDVLYSYVRFVTYSRSFYEQSQYNRDLQDRMKSDYRSDEERLIEVFRNMRSAFNFRANLNWLTSPSCFPIRFEALYDELLLLSDNRRIGPILGAIFEYLNVGGWSPAEIYDGIYGKGPTFMEGRDKIRQFDRLDRAVIEQVLADEEFRAMVRAYGYEG